MTTKSEPAWQFQHFVECKVPRQFAWSYWTNIANWNDPPATFHLDGPFVAGSQLTTSLPGQTLHSKILDVRPGLEAIIEMQLPGAILSFQWKFESAAEDRTRITQRLALSGTDAASFVDQVRIMEQTMPDGMNRLVADIEKSLNAR